jgi:hypothetical protein
LERHPSGHCEAVLSGLTCADVFDGLKEEFEGRHLVLFATLPGLEDLLSSRLKVEYTTIGDVRKSPIYVIGPASVERVLREEGLNQDDAWWFFPYPKPLFPEDVWAIELKPDLGYFVAKPQEGLPLFVSCLHDLAVFTRDRKEVERLIQRLFEKYVKGLDFIPAEDVKGMDFIRQLQIEMDALERTGAPREACFTFVTDAAPTILKDTPDDRRRVVYEYDPAARRFERREMGQIGLFRLLLENWGALAVWLSSCILIVGAFVILLAVLVMIVFFILSFIL